MSIGMKEFLWSDRRTCDFILRLEAPRLRRTMRSKLFVPGARQELFAKALAGEADALSFDLEDSVVEARKAEARRHVAALFASDALHACAKTLIVRVNAVDSAHF